MATVVDHLPECGTGQFAASVSSANSNGAALSQPQGDGMGVEHYHKCEKDHCNHDEPLDFDLLIKFIGGVVFVVSLMFLRACSP